MTIQDILNEVELLTARPTAITLTLPTEPTQKDWEDEWISLGNNLPIKIGVELYWNDGIQNRGLYMTVEDVFTIPIRMAKILDTFESSVVGVEEIPAARNIWVRWWGADNYLIGIGTYDGVDGTYAVYMDGTVEIITTYIAVAVHSKALKLVVEDSGNLKLFDIPTITLGDTIGAIAWSPDERGPTSKITVFPAPVETRSQAAPVSSGWGFIEMVAWVDETDDGNLDLYFADGNDVYFYEEGVGSSLLFSISPSASIITSICYQNNRLALSYNLGATGIFIGEIYDLSGAVLATLGSTILSAAGGANISLDNYATWHFRKDPDDSNYIHVLYSIDPKIPGKSNRYTGTDLEEYGNHTWNRYTRYDTSTDTYYGQYVYDSRLNDFNVIGDTLILPDDDAALEVLITNNNLHRWGASLFGERKQAYTTILPSPDGEKLLLGWGSSFGGKNQWQDYIVQEDNSKIAGAGGGAVRPIRESGRHGCIIVSIGEEKSTGRVYKVSAYSEPLATEIEIYEWVQQEEQSSITLDLTDILDNLDPDYEILKITFPLLGTGLGFVVLQFNEDTTIGNYLSQQFHTTAAVTSTTPSGGVAGIKMFAEITSVDSLVTLYLHDFRSTTKHTTVFGAGGLWYASQGNPMEFRVAGIWKKDAAERVSKITLARTLGDFVIGTKILITALRTKGKYADGGKHDYRMA